MAREAEGRLDQIVSCLGLDRDLAKLCGGYRQIALLQLCPAEPRAALARVEPVADCVGEVASSFGGRAGRDRVTRATMPKKNELPS